MKIIESILTKNPCYKSGRKIEVKGLMLHSIGVPQPDATVFVKRWNDSDYDDACVHGFIDANDGTVYQTLPWNHRAWHCGGAGNNTHIGVEMCEPDCIKYTSGASFTCSNKTKARSMATTTYNAAVELFAFLCKTYNLNPLQKGVIISHKEGCAMGIASNHGDPEHLWSQLGMKYTMDTFRNDVSKAIGGVVAPTITPTPSETTYLMIGCEGNAVEQLQKNLNTVLKAGLVVDGDFGEKTEKAVKDFQKKYNLLIDGIYGEKSDAKMKEVLKSSETFLVKVTADVLNVRSGAGIEYRVVTTVRKGEVFTIVGTSGNWGKLKSGIGYISLDYVVKV